MLLCVFGHLLSEVWSIKTNDELAELMTYEYNKSHKSTKIKLVWTFTSNARRENGKKSIQVETDVNTTTIETKEQMKR
jgi:hypothetical protein